MTTDPPPDLAQQVRLSARDLDAFAPFHILLAPCGAILSAGRTLRKLLAPMPVLGGRFADCFSLVKPRTMPEAGLGGLIGRRIIFATRAARPVHLRGMVLTVGDRILMNFSLGSDVAEVAEAFDLRGADFAPSDGTVDMIFVMSAQAQLLADTRDLNEALSRSRTTAERLALTDPLTDLPNRRALQDRLDSVVRDRCGFALMHLDLDNFKTVNDQLGHAAGDAVLTHAASEISALLRPGDFLARVGGDEFVAVLQSAVQGPEVERMAQAIMARLSRPITVDQHTIAIGASIGIRLCPDGADRDPSLLLTEADRALYRAKEAGRGRIVLFDDELQRALEHETDTIAEVRAALDSGRFEPFFQPQIDAQTGAVTGVETLMRLRRGDGSIVGPSAFLAEAERAKLIGRIDEHMVDRALAALAGWDRRGLAIPALAINLTEAHLADGQFPDRLAMQIDRYALEPERIVLEIVETVALDRGGDHVAKMIDRLAARGFRLHMDDFGAGHTSIGGLRALPITTVKIDRSLVANIDRDPDLRRLTGAIVDLAAKLGISALAEGVERESEATVARQIGFSAIQGYWVAKPMPAAALERWLLARQTVAPNRRFGLG